MKLRIIVAVVVLGLIAGLVLVGNSHLNQKQPESDGYLQKIQLAQQQLEVEVVDTPTAMSQGLSNRESIGSDGMLFVYSSPVVPIFWMKDMLFGLDIIWILQDTVVEITENVAPPLAGTQQSELKRYQPSQPVDLVLEVPAGFVSRHHIQVGDQLRLLESEE